MRFARLLAPHVLVGSSMMTLCGLSVAIALVPLAFILFFVVTRGITALDWNFFTQTPKPHGETGGGMANAMIGTLMSRASARCLRCPSASWPASSSPSTPVAPGLGVRFSADTLNGVPSIVIGLFVYALVVLPMKEFTALAGGIALGIMMIPIIMRTTEELLRLVPASLREGALALGATHGRAVFTVVLPAALPGILTGVMLALARIAGETAPLLFTALNNHYWSTSLDPADRDAHRPGLHLRDVAVRRPASPGLGGRVGAGDARAHLFGARSLRDAPARTDARMTLTVGSGFSVTPSASPSS